MGKNIDALVDSGKFALPTDFIDSEWSFFVERAEWRLERLRRTDFDLLGEHTAFAQESIDIAVEETRENFGF